MDTTAPQPPAEPLVPKYKPKGKIAWLPTPVRNRINQLLLDGFSFPAILKALGPDGAGLNVSNLFRYHIPADPSGYTVFISTNPLAEQDGTFIRFSQMNRMNPAPGSPHLRMFKDHFAKAKRYRLFPAEFDGTRIKRLDMSRYIEKRQLNLLHSSHLKPHEMEYPVFNSAA